MVKNNLKGKKQTKKKSGAVEPTDTEIVGLEKDLKKLEKKDSSYGSPQPPPENRGMELVITVGNNAVFKNTNGTLYQIGLNPEIEELVLKKIKVMV